MLLVTGSEGLIGRHLSSRIEAAGIAVRKLDVRRSIREDVRKVDALASALQDVTGVVHLAAVSRVVWAERQPRNCWSTNVDALESLLQLCHASSLRPWVLFVSSREVYGDAKPLPVAEDAPFSPLNTYGRSKCEGERIAQRANQEGLRVNVCRLSNVYGCPLDHKDRVVMAFADVAANGGTMRVEGAGNTFDFTAVKDVAEGLWRAVEACIAGERLPAIHLVSGQGTSLLDLATLAARSAKGTVWIEEVNGREFDVSCFVGDPARAHKLLGWKATTPLAVGVDDLIGALSAVRRGSN
jgi:UDP-glucose 4-epimerase